MFGAPNLQFVAETLIQSARAPSRRSPDLAIRREVCWLDSRGPDVRQGRSNMWNRVLRIAAAAILCYGAVLVAATLATIQWSPEHGLRWNLLMLWRWDQREVVDVIVIMVTTLAALVVLIGSRLAQTRQR